MSRVFAPHEPGVRLSLGISKAGKTTLMRRDLATAVRHMPVVVFDQTRTDFLTTPVPSHRCSTLETAIRLVDVHERARKREQAHAFVVYQPNGDLFNQGAKLCDWAVEQRHRMIGIAFPEAHLIFPVKRTDLPDGMMKMLTAYRHYQVACWFDSQRAALLNTTIRGQAGELNVFTIAASTDIDAVAESVRDKKAFVEALDECARHYDRAEYGYHVTLGANRRPPYIVER